jgi:ABC-type nickel/cobalt efflux system permease component RcnA
MSISAIILINVLTASILVVLVAAVMLVPSRLRAHFEEGHTHRQKAALREQRQAEAARRHGHRRADRGPRWNPIQDT